jgi:hypothetical protein
MKLIFDTCGNDKQKQCAKYWIDDETVEVGYGGSKGSGKSFLGCNLIFGDGFVYPNTSYFIARKNLNDVRKFTIPSIYEAFEKLNIGSDYYKFDGKDNYFTLYNRSTIYLLEGRYLPNDPNFERFGSLQMTRGWIEEGGQFTAEAKQNLSATIGRWKNDDYSLKGKLLITCNPSKNFLYKDFYKPFKEGSLPKTRKFIQALPEDNKMLAKGYLEHLNNTLTGSMKERLLKGNWEYDDNPYALCEYDNILSVFKNNHLVKNGKRYLTADVARFGSDKAIILVWEDWIVIDFLVFDVSKTTEIQTAINALRQKWNIPAKNCIADDDGVGGGVVDNCKINGFVNNARPFEEKIQLGQQAKPNFKNLQSQCIYYLAEAVNKNSIFIEAEMPEKYQEEIIEELETIERVVSDGIAPIQIVGKEAVKESIGRSPDWRDALMMRKWFDLNPPIQPARYHW